MSQKISRRDLKRNDLAETFQKTAGYVSHHRRGVVEVSVIGAAVVLVVAGVLAYRLYRANAAGAELSRALQILATPLAGAPNATGAAKTYATDAEREKDAQVYLRKASSHSATPAGRAAAVILAARDSNPAHGAELFSRIAREGSAEVAAAAEIDAARLLAADGKLTEAADRLKRAIESSDVRAPKDALLFALGETYEKAGLAADARSAYQRLLTDYPNSSYRQEARSKVPNVPNAGAFNPS